MNSRPLSMPGSASSVSEKNLFSVARSELVWVTIANVVITVVNVVIGLLLVWYFSVEDYGRFSYFVNMFGLFRLLASFGLTSQVVFELSRARGTGEQLGSYFYPLFINRTITLIGTTLLVAAIGYVRGEPLLTIAGGTAALALVNDFGVGALQGLGLTRRVVGVLGLQPLLFALGSALTMAYRLSAEAIYIVYIFSFICAILLAAIWLLQSVRLAGRNIAGVGRIWSSWRFAGSMYLLAFAGTLFTSYATLYLGGVQRFADTARITIPLNLIFMPTTVIHFAITTAYFPRSTEMYARHENAHAQMLFTLFYELVSSFTLITAVCLAMYPRAVLGLLYGARYQASAPLLALVAPVAYLYTAQTVLTFTLVAQGRIRVALIGPFTSAFVLLGAITATSGRGGDLELFAVMHTTAAVLGLVVQTYLVGRIAWNQFGKIGKRSFAAVVLVGAGRVLVPDSPDRIVRTLIVLALTVAVYSLWVWRTVQTETHPF